MTLLSNCIYMLASTLVPSQLGETFLSSKHLDYLATIAEHISGERVA